MANEASTRAVIGLALTYCRRHDPAEVDAAVRLWCNTFSNASARDLEKAVTLWAETLDDSAQFRPALPVPKTIRYFLKQARGQVSSEPQPVPTRARPEFVKAHLDAARRIAQIAPATSLDQVLAGPRLPDHGDCGTDCTRCDTETAMSAAAAERKARIRAVLAELPAPIESASMRCRCGGTGMLSTPATEQALFDLDPRHGAAYPCNRCNAAAYQQWLAP